MRAEAGLTQRETQIAELLAWGAAKKEVADRLSISPRTVENTARNIYSKIGIQKATELCVWWFCTHCGVSFDLSPIKRTIIACFFLAIIYRMNCTPKATPTDCSEAARLPNVQRHEEPEDGRNTN